MHAHNAGQAAKVRCGLCSVTRFYKPAELREVYGNVTIREIGQKMRCMKCDKGEYMDADLLVPLGAEAISIKYRRLVRIEFLRHIVWRDEP
ncbi:hypothetical protein [Mesorhizobium sp. INR15]|uniref:hypothetical protein n=1 Tax=Mesorhizobium sp. INR15 TaxID=2654248 RepID=UPI001896832D|nr:hypothetical protein [Mesorhizobium sp. INR15]QPC94731.1 hypothetical protein GA829_31350 [Mesorhizobium sp. INR15]